MFESEDAALDELDSQPELPQPLAPELLAELRIQEARLNRACFGLTNQKPSPRQTGASL